MKKIIKKYFFLAFAITMYSCNEDEKYDILERYIPETVTSDEIAPVLNLQAQYMDSNSETVLVTWMNPEDKFCLKWKSLAVPRMIIFWVNLFCWTLFLPK